MKHLKDEHKDKNPTSNWKYIHGLEKTKEIIEVVFEVVPF